MSSYQSTGVKSDYAVAVGDRLRAVRNRQGLSLIGVEEKSGRRWKAVVVGSYERGDRGITIERLCELAEFYGVPLAALLPGADDSEERKRERLALAVVVNLSTALGVSVDQILAAGQPTETKGAA